VQKGASVGMTEKCALDDGSAAKSALLLPEDYCTLVPEAWLTFPPLLTSTKGITLSVFHHRASSLHASEIDDVIVSHALQRVHLH